MKQTAVEFLLSHMWTTDWVNYTREQKLNVIQQAKQMDKEQKIESYLQGSFDDGPDVNKAEQYYNETYNK